jgi:hypothetical protein
MNINFGLGGVDIGGMNFGMGVSHNMSTTPLRVGDKVHLKSLNTNKYLSSEQYDRLSAHKDHPGQYETFIVESKDKPFGRDVHYGDRIGLRGPHGKFLCADYNSSVVCNRDQFSDLETFTIIDGANFQSTNIIPNWGALCALRTHLGKYISLEPNLQVGGFRDQPDHIHVTIAGLQGDINQYQRSPQVNMNISQPQGFGMNVNLPQQMYTQPSYSPPPQHAYTTQQGGYTSPVQQQPPQNYSPHQSPPPQHVYTTQQGGYTSPVQQPPQNIHMQTTYVGTHGAGLCPKCGGLGGFSAFGRPCPLDDFHFKTQCPVCHGQKTTTRQIVCQKCGGKGAFGAFGPCDLTDVHFRNKCDACDGQCYF